jgi:hypothetical protein
MTTRIGASATKAKTNGLPAKRRFTVDEYYRMAKAGILRPDERVELLEGDFHNGRHEQLARLAHSLL